MPTIKDVSIIDSNTAKAVTVESGLETDDLQSEPLRLEESDGLPPHDPEGPAARSRSGQGLSPALRHARLRRRPHRVHRPSRTPPTKARACCSCRASRAKFDAKGADLELLHMVTPKPPAAVEAGLPGGPGYFFNRQTLRPLSDASGGRVRRFCAESSVRLSDGSRLTPTNAIQAGEMHYKEGGGSPYHLHKGTDANPDGAAHCYMTFKGRGKVDVGETSQEIEPGTLVYFPPGIAAPAQRARRHARLLRDPGMAKLQDDDLEQGSRERAQVVLRSQEPRRGARGVEPELSAPARCTSLRRRAARPAAPEALGARHVLRVSSNRPTQRSEIFSCTEF